MDKIRKAITKFYNNGPVAIDFLEEVYKVTGKGLDWLTCEEGDHIFKALITINQRTSNMLYWYDEKIDEVWMVLSVKEADKIHYFPEIKEEIDNDKK